MTKEQLLDKFDYSALPVNGNDVMEILGIEPGPKIGKILNDLMNAAFDNPDITREECITFNKTKICQ